MLIAALVCATAVTAGTDWWAVWRERAPVERFAKPLVMVCLIGFALVIDAEPNLARWLVIVGLGFGLIGDVMLLPSVDRFLYGLAAFLVGHSFYIAAFASMDLAMIRIVGGLAAALVVFGYLGWPVVRSVLGTAMGVPVISYMGVLAAMVVLATATHRWPIAAGGVLFAISDCVLGLDRFVSPAPQRRIVVHMLYHLGQFGFVLGLAWVA